MDPVAMHAGGHAAPPALPVRVAVDALAGLLAAVVANAPMHRQSEGTAPAFALAGAVARRPPEAASPGLASGLHYLSGALVGAAFALLADRFATVLPDLPTVPGTALSLSAHVAAVAVALAGLYVAVAYLLVPPTTDWSGGRLRTVRSQWATTATVYAVALALLVPLLTVAFV